MPTHIPTRSASPRSCGVTLITMKRFLTLTIALVALICAAQKPKFDFGLQAGIGGYATTGALHNNFAGAVAFTGGLTAQYGNLRFKADVAYSQPSFRNDNMWARFDDNGHPAEINAASNASMVGLAVQAGFSVAHIGRLTITPAAGMFFGHYAWDINQIQWSKDDAGKDMFEIVDKRHAALGSVRWIASIDFDIRLHDKYTDAFGPQQRLRSSIRVTPFVTRAALRSTVPPVGGCLVGCAITYSGLLRSL